MKISHKELARLRKALITATGTLASQGKLAPRQANRFIDYVTDLTSLSTAGRVERFRNDQAWIEKIGVTSRVTFRVRNEGQDVGHRAGVNTGRIILQPERFITPFVLSDEFILENLEGGPIEDRIVRMMARQMGNDVETALVEADTLGHAAIESDVINSGSDTGYVVDRLLDGWNGWAKLARSGHVIDAQEEAIGVGLVGRMWRAMPIKFRRDRSSLRLIMSPDLYSIWQEKITTRETAMGDDAAQGRLFPNILGIRVAEANLWPFAPTVTEHVVLTGTTEAQLLHAPISDVVVIRDDLGDENDAPFEDTTDYVVDLDNGTIVRDGGGDIGSGDTVKITYKTNPTVVLTNMNNLITAIGLDIKILKDFEIFGDVHEWAIHTKIQPQIEEVDALVFAKNIKNAA